MQTLPVLHFKVLEAVPARRVGRITAASIRRVAIRLAQSVFLSGSASFIVMAAQHRLMERASSMPVTAASAEVSIQTASLALMRPDLHGSVSPTLAFIATADHPSVALHIPTSPADPEPSRSRKASVIGGADRDRHSSTALAAISKPAASAVPLPPLRSMLGEAEQAHVRVSRFPASLRTVAAGATIVPATPTDDAPRSRFAPLRDATFVAPLVYGLRLAASAGDIAIATNDRLVVGTTDAISALVR